MEKFMDPLSPEVGNLPEIPSFNGPIRSENIAVVIHQANELGERIN
jgi:hypothetical protein